MADPTPDFDVFLKAYPSYRQTQAIDDLRRTQYARLDAGEHVYLDYTGGGLYAEASCASTMALLSQNVFGNPHSSNPTSLAATHFVERARDDVLEFFNADPEEYDRHLHPQRQRGAQAGRRSRIRSSQASRTR